MDSLAKVIIAGLTFTLLSWVIVAPATYTSFPVCAAGEYVRMTSTGPTCATPVTGGVTTGIIAYYNGACPATWSEVTATRGFMIVGTPSGGTDSGTVGVAFTNQQDKANTPTFTGNAATITHAGTAVDNHASHTHDYTQVINHTHTVNISDSGHTHNIRSQTGSTGSVSSWEHGTIDTSSTANETLASDSATTGITASSVNPSGGVATGTTVGPSAVLTHGVTQPNNHSYTPVGTNSSIATSNLLAYIQLRVCSKD